MLVLAAAAAPLTDPELEPDEADDPAAPALVLELALALALELELELPPDKVDGVWEFEALTCPAMYCAKFG